MKEVNTKYYCDYCGRAMSELEYTKDSLIVEYNIRHNRNDRYSYEKHSLVICEKCAEEELEIKIEKKMYYCMVLFFNKAKKELLKLLRTKEGKNGKIKSCAIKNIC